MLEYSIVILFYGFLLVVFTGCIALKGKYTAKFCCFQVRPGVTLNYFTWFGYRKVSSQRVLQTIRSALEVIEQQLETALSTEEPITFRVVWNRNWLSKAEAVTYGCHEIMMPERNMLKGSYWRHEIVHVLVGQIAPQTPYYLHEGIAHALECGPDDPQQFDILCGLLRNGMIDVSQLSKPSSSSEREAFEDDKVVATEFFQKRALGWLLVFHLMHRRGMTAREVLALPPEEYPGKVQLIRTFAERLIGYCDSFSASEVLV